MLMFERLPECTSDKHAGELLGKIRRETVTIVREVKPPLKNNKFFHDGWSPIFITLRAQLICMINIRRGLCGYRHVLWDEDSRTHNITTLVVRWRKLSTDSPLNWRKQKRRS